jgi:hypothetical protein
LSSDYNRRPAGIQPERLVEACAIGQFGAVRESAC